MDTIVSPHDRHCVVSLVQRVTGCTLVGKLRARSVAATNRRAALPRVVRSGEVEGGAGGSRQFPEALAISIGHGGVCCNDVAEEAVGELFLSRGRRGDPTRVQLST
jgi:hypothetical protein